MNIYEALESDHRKVESLLDSLLQASQADNDAWKGILDEIRSELIPHAHAEEAVFYNALRDADESKGLVAHSYAEHAMAETEIRALGAAKLIDANWTSAVEKLRKDVKHHIEEEEGKIFEAARRIFSEQEAQQIGEAFEKLKPEMAKDSDSMVASQVDMFVNMLPKRLGDSFRKTISGGSKDTAA